MAEPTVPYIPEALVLAKIKGFSPWPAMVIDESLLPTDIQKRKPKVTTQKRKRRGKTGRGSEEAIPVRFFADDTYNWMDVADLTPLTPVMVKTFQKKGSKQFVAAYEIAQSPPEMAAFVRWGSSGPPPEPVEDESTSDNKELADETPKPQTTKRKTRQVKPPAPKRAKALPKKSKVVSLLNESSGDDDDLSEYEDDFGAGVPSGKELAARLKRFEPLVLNAKISIQRAFINDISPLGPSRVDPTTMTKASKTLEQMLLNAEVIPMTLVYKSGLFRVLIATLKRPALRSLSLADREWAKVYAKFVKLVGLWFAMEVEVDDKWSMPEEADQEPNSPETTTASADAPDVTMESPQTSGGTTGFSQRATV